MDALARWNAFTRVNSAGPRFGLGIRVRPGEHPCDRKVRGVTQRRLLVAVMIAPTTMVNTMLPMIEIRREDPTTANTTLIATNTSTKVANWASGLRRFIA